MELLNVLKDFDPKVLSDGEIRMTCPFRENHLDGKGHDSFFISPDKGVYHCFSCGCSGRLVSLLTTKFGVPLSQALSVGTFVEHDEVKKEWELDRSYKVVPPKEFLSRGFKAETLKHFRFGYTDDGWIMIPFYDNFKDPRKLLGYQLRKDIKRHTFGDSANNKKRVVRNSKGFRKSDYLYNLDISYDYVVLVEGYSDVMRLYQHGYNAVALLGVSLSDYQEKQLAKFATIYLALDNDMAGREATEKIYHRLRNLTDIRLVPYHTKDPGECLSPKVWSKAFDSSTDYATYSLEMALNWDGYIKMRDEILKNMDK